MARGVTRITPERLRGVRFVDMGASLGIGLYQYSRQGLGSKAMEAAEKPFNFELLIEINRGIEEIHRRLKENERERGSLFHMLECLDAQKRAVMLRRPLP